MDFVGPSLEFADKIGLIQAAKRQLVSQPDPAAAELATALAELRKLYSVADEGLTQYLALSFYDGQSIDERRREQETLRRLQGGTFQVEMMQARTHSSKLRSIYLRFLNPWFSRIVNSPEIDLMSGLFQDFGTADDEFVTEIERLANWLSQQASRTLNLVDAGNIREANQLIRDARVDTRPQQETLLDVMRRLSTLSADFTELAR